MSYQVVLQKSPNIPLGVEENTKYSFSLFSWIEEDIREEKKKEIMLSIYYLNHII